MSDSKHPVDLETLFFTKCSVSAVPNHIESETKDSGEIANHIEIHPTDDTGRKWTAMMRTVVNAEKDPAWPYHVEMEAVAFLATDETLDEATARRGVLITAHNVLFGAIRENVLWITGRQPYGPLMLGLSVLAPPPPAVKSGAAKAPK
ncbi:MAG: hypothetical protein V4679_14745 [Pseudomonadota bacterium]